MNIKKIFSDTRGEVVVILLLISLAVASVFFYKNSRAKPKLSPGVPVITFALEPVQIQPEQNFALVLKVNPNGASFHAFELYAKYDPAKVDLQNPENPGQNIISNYPLIKSDIDTGAGMITVIGTRTGSSFSGTADQEIARVNLKTNSSTGNNLIFTWNNDTKLGNKIRFEKIDGNFK